MTNGSETSASEHHAPFPPSTSSPTYHPGSDSMPVDAYEKPGYSSSGVSSSYESHAYYSSSGFISQEDSSINSHSPPLPHPAHQGPAYHVLIHQPPITPIHLAQNMRSLPPTRSRRYSAPTQQRPCIKRHLLLLFLYHHQQQTIAKSPHAGTLSQPYFSCQSC